MSLPALLDRVLGDPLAAAGSARAIGWFGWNVPVELILAAGAVPVQLDALSGDSDTALADRYLESSFSAQSRCVAQRWLSGDLDVLSDVIFSRSDDSAQRLYYYLCELQRFGECKGPRPLLYDLARIGRASSVAHTVESTRSLAAAIGADTARLEAASQRVSGRLTLLDALAELRASDEVPSGRLAYRISRAARSDWSDEFDSSLRDWLAEPVTTKPRKRVLLVGSVPTDDQLHAALETDGVVVVGEINEACGLSALPVVAHNHQDCLVATGNSARSRKDMVSSVDVGSPGASEASSPSVGIEAVAHRCYRQTAAVRTLLQSPAEIVKCAQASRADGVIVWMLATDTGLAWEAPRIAGALRDARLPTLMLTSQPRSLSADALEKIAQFRTTMEPT